MKNYLLILMNWELLLKDGMKLEEGPVKTLISHLRKENNCDNEDVIIKLSDGGYYHCAQKELCEIIDKYEKEEVDNLLATGTYKPGVFLLCEIDVKQRIEDGDFKTILECMIGDNCKIHHVTISKGVFEKRKEYDENDLKNSEIEKEIVEEYNKRCYENS